MQAEAKAAHLEQGAEHVVVAAREILQGDKASDYDDDDDGVDVGSDDGDGDAEDEDEDNEGEEEEDDDGGDEDDAVDGAVSSGSGYWLSALCHTREAYLHFGHCQALVRHAHPSKHQPAPRRG